MLEEAVGGATQVGHGGGVADDGHAHQQAVGGRLGQPLGHVVDVVAGLLVGETTNGAVDPAVKTPPQIVRVRTLFVGLGARRR